MGLKFVLLMHAHAYILHVLWLHGCMFMVHEGLFKELIRSLQKKTTHEVDPGFMQTDCFKLLIVQ
jgi:hypothetical protein